MSYEKDKYGNRAEKCINCKFCGRLIRSNTAANGVEHIKCRRYPPEEKMRPYDWCGEWKKE